VIPDKDAGETGPRAMGSKSEYSPKLFWAVRQSGIKPHDNVGLLAPARSNQPWRFVHSLISG